MWLRHKGFSDLVRNSWGNGNAQQSFMARLDICKGDIVKWNSLVFGKVQKQSASLKKKLEDVKTEFRTEEVISKESQIQAELDEWFAREELLWRQRSRVDWPREGDSNTRFFHTRASQRKKKNTITKIKGPNDRCITDEKEIGDEAVHHFESIFKSTSPKEKVEWEENLSFIHNSVSAKKINFLCAPFTEIEIQNAVYQLGSTKAPGPDGFSALFYQEYWCVVKHEVINFSLKFLNEGSGLERGMNDTLITLIPKTKSPITFDEFRPISLCNVAMKIITKALANRLKEVLNDCISASQSAFIPGRLITDNILIAHELINYMRSRTKGSVGYCCIKLDMSKAYDRMEWDFLEEVQRRMGFPETWIEKIMCCVKSVVYRIRVNQAISESFCPERGIRQGDPLSPYLFVLCAEWLAQRIDLCQQNGELQGLKVSRNAPVISHLLFADDCILFVKADVDNIMKLKCVLKSYEAISGQQINYGKSELVVSNNVNQDLARCLGSILGVKVVDSIDKYLGLPICLNGRKTAMLNFIEDRMWKRVNGWKEKLLSVAGKEVLIKSIVQAIPVYAMSCFKMPKRIFDRWHSIISSFWWNGAKGSRYMAWLDKKKLQAVKEEGGLGLRNFYLVNLALLIKQAWRIYTNPELLLSKVYKARYFKHSGILEAEEGFRPSWGWRSIYKGSLILRRWLKDMDKSEEQSVLLNSDGALSTKRAYDILLYEAKKEVADQVGESSSNEHVKSFWRRFWRVKSQNKAKIFMWKLYHNAIPVMANLSNRGCNVETRCVVCGFKEESTVHLFLRCWWAVEFWKGLLNSTRFLDIGFSTLEDWIWFCVQELDKDEIIKVFCGARWIWWSRNLLWHKQESINVVTAVMKAKFVAQEVGQANFRFVVTHPEAETSWRPPEEGWFTVSCYGSWDRESRVAGIGVVCRDSRGVVLFAAAHCLDGMSSIFEVEGLAMRLGMELAMKKGLKRVIFRSDNVEIISVLLAKSFLQREWSWVKECCEMMESTRDWRLEHVFREANSVADQLASRARERRCSWTTMEAIPIFLSSAILRDMSLAGMCS
ncbi:hypothetical protein QQ045_019904 [Rhodiola kirilowii]